MNEEQETSKGTDEIGNNLPSENEANEVIEEQGDDAAAGIPRDTDAAKHEHKPDETDDNRELTGAP